MHLSAVERRSLDALLSAIANAFETEGRTGAEAAVAKLRAAPSRRVQRRKSRQKPGLLLQKVCGLENALDWAHLALECDPFLDWEKWEGKGLDKTISNRLFTTELLGPDGHIFDADVRVGLLVSDSHTDYPLSNHAGEETYFVIAGEAEWVLGNAAYRRIPPGELVHHPAFEMHGRRTLSEPFLGAWRWSGDLDLSSFSVADRPLTR